MEETGYRQVRAAMRLGLCAVALAAAWLICSALFGGSSASAAEQTPDDGPGHGILSMTVGELDSAVSQLGATVDDVVSDVTSAVEPAVANLPQPVPDVVDSVPQVIAPVTAVLSDHLVSDVASPVAEGADGILNQLSGQTETAPDPPAATVTTPTVPGPATSATPAASGTASPVASKAPGLAQPVADAGLRRSARSPRSSSAPFLIGAGSGSSAPASDETITPAGSDPAQPLPGRLPGEYGSLLPPASLSGSGSASSGGIAPGAAAETTSNAYDPDVFTVSLIDVRDDVLPPSPTFDSDTTPD